MQVDLYTAGLIPMHLHTELRQPANLTMQDGKNEIYKISTRRNISTTLS